MLHLQGCHHPGTVLPTVGGQGLHAGHGGGEGVPLVIFIEAAAGQAGRVRGWLLQGPSMGVGGSPLAPPGIYWGAWGPAQGGCHPGSPNPGPDVQEWSRRRGLRGPRGRAPHRALLADHLVQSPGDPSNLLLFAHRRLGDGAPQTRRASLGLSLRAPMPAQSGATPPPAPAAPPQPSRGLQTLRSNPRPAPSGAARHAGARSSCATRRPRAGLDADYNSQGASGLGAAQPAGKCSSNDAPKKLL